MAVRLLESGAMRLLQPVVTALDGGRALSDTRDYVEALLVPAEVDPEWSVAAGIVDAFDPPGFLVTWGTDWVAPKTHCHATATLDVVCIAARMEPESGFVTLEQLVELAWSRLAAGGLVPFQVTAPARYDIGGVPYLASHVSVNSPVTLGGT